MKIVTSEKLLHQVSAFLLPDEVKKWIKGEIFGSSISLCSGTNYVADLNIDINPKHIPDILADVNTMRIDPKKYDTVVAFLPKDKSFQWMHKYLNRVHSLAKRKIIFIGEFCPVNNKGEFTLCEKFTLVDTAMVPFVPNTGPYTLAIRQDENHFVPVDREFSDDFKLSNAQVFIEQSARHHFGKVNLISVFEEGEDYG